MVKFKNYVKMGKIMFLHRGQYSLRLIPVRKMFVYMTVYDEGVEFIKMDSTWAGNTTNVDTITKFVPRIYHD